MPRQILSNIGKKQSLIFFVNKVQISMFIAAGLYNSYIIYTIYNLIRKGTFVFKHV